MDKQPTTNDEQLDQEYMHIYRIMHNLFHIDLDDSSPYTKEELNIEAV